MVEGLALIVLFSVHANSYLALAHSAIFESGIYRIKVTGGLALQRQDCCVQGEKEKCHLDFSISSSVSESFSLIILGKMLITFYFPLVWVFRIFVCLFVCVLKREKKNLFHKWRHVPQMSYEDSILEKCLLNAECK